MGETQNGLKLIVTFYWSPFRLNLTKYISLAAKHHWKYEDSIPKMISVRGKYSKQYKGLAYVIFLVISGTGRSV